MYWKKKDNNIDNRVNESFYQILTIFDSGDYKDFVLSLHKDFSQESLEIFTSLFNTKNNILFTASQYNIDLETDDKKETCCLPLKLSKLSSFLWGEKKQKNLASFREAIHKVNTKELKKIITTILIDGWEKAAQAVLEYSQYHEDVSYQDTVSFIKEAGNIKQYTYIVCKAIEKKKTCCLKLETMDWKERIEKVVNNILSNISTIVDNNETIQHLQLQSFSKTLKDIVSHIIWDWKYKGSSIVSNSITVLLHVVENDIFLNNLEKKEEDQSKLLAQTLSNFCNLLRDIETINKWSMPKDKLSYINENALFEI